ncbi:hypothetical protein [Brevibacterium gallinarum]|uniref:Uncharacterized protein n=1 Tax=Brevibacterium gallinarum TaxID=2762220 RepID=A0ABR8WXH2_9MICO|nr:hypothetical protein [Brevibacterium gallinarum]MBD8021291.1 hypothetical protein [Brevibacterium gallinarum]
MTALRITSEFIARYAPHYEITELEDRLLTKDAKKARKKERLKYKSLLRFAEWKAVAVLPMLNSYSDKTTQKDIEYLTFLALEEDTPDRWRIPILSIIDGVGKPFASAILSAVYPKDFALMDARSVGVLFDAGLLETKNTARVPYEDYLGVVRMLASEANVSLHEVYRALYAYAELGELAAEDTAATADGTDSATTKPAETQPAKTEPGQTTSAEAKTDTTTAAKSSTSSRSGAQKTTAAKTSGQKSSSADSSPGTKSATSTAKKTTAQKSTTTKAAPKKAAAKTATGKNSTAKKSTAKKTAAKKTTAKKSTAKKSAAKKSNKK